MMEVFQIDSSNLLHGYILSRFHTLRDTHVYQVPWVLHLLISVVLFFLWWCYLHPHHQWCRVYLGSNKQEVLSPCVRVVFKNKSCCILYGTLSICYLT